MATLQEYNETTSREEHFEALYTDYRPAIRRRIQFLLHGANREQEEDIEQMTWLKVWRGLKEEGSGQKVTYQWLSVIATHAVYDFLRHTYLMRHGGQEVERPLFASLDADRGTYEEIEAFGDIGEQVADREEIAEALSTMQPGPRQAFLLRAWGYSYAEILEATGYGYHGLKDVLNRTRKKLRTRRETMEAAS